jgi:hypothetical protein
MMVAFAFCNNNKNNPVGGSGGLLERDEYVNTFTRREYTQRTRLAREYLAKVKRLVPSMILDEGATEPLIIVHPGPHKCLHLIFGILRQMHHNLWLCLLVHHHGLGKHLTQKIRNEHSLATGRVTLLSSTRLFDGSSIIVGIAMIATLLSSLDPAATGSVMAIGSVTPHIESPSMTILLQSPPTAQLPLSSSSTASIAHGRPSTASSRTW